MCNFNDNDVQANRSHTPPGQAHAAGPSLVHRSMTIMMMRVIARPHQGEGAHAARVPHKDPADGQAAAVVGAVGVDGRRVVGPRVARAGQVVLDPCAESGPSSPSRWPGNFPFPWREIPVPMDKG